MISCHGNFLFLFLWEQGGRLKLHEIGRREEAKDEMQEKQDFRL
jgi:hypothetical protein